MTKSLSSCDFSTCGVTQMKYCSPSSFPPPRPRTNTGFFDARSRTLTIFSLTTLAGTQCQGRHRQVVSIDRDSSPIA